MKTGTGRFRSFSIALSILAWIQPAVSSAQTLPPDPACIEHYRAALTQDAPDPVARLEQQHGYVPNVPNFVGPKRAERPLPPYQLPPEPVPTRLPIDDLHFMQNSVKNSHGDDSPYTVIGNAQSIREGKLDPEIFPPIQVWRDATGKVWALDHRRVVAYQLSGKVHDVKVEWVTEEAVKKDSFKMTTADAGETVFLQAPNGKYLLVSRTGVVPERSWDFYYDLLKRDDVRRAKDGGFEYLVRDPSSGGLQVKRATTYDELQKSVGPTEVVDLDPWIHQHTQVYSAVADRLDDLVAEVPGARFSGRLKEKFSLENKIFDRIAKNGSDYGLDDVGDTIAFRYTVKNRADLLKMQEVVRKKLGYEILEEEVKNDPSGYRAVHFNGKTPEGFKFEVQVLTERTAAVAAWTHDRVYKAPGHYSSEYLARLRRLGEELFRYSHALDEGTTGVNKPDMTGILPADLFSL